MNFNDICAVERELALHSMVQNKAFYEHECGSVSSDGDVVAGLCGHHFIHQGYNQWERQFSGELSFSEQGIEAWRRVARARQERASSLGLVLTHFIAPDKQSVLPQFRWVDGPPPGSVRRPVFQLRQLMVEAGMELEYPAETFHENSGLSELYWRGDSHWCASGVVLAASLLSVRWFGSELPLERLRFERLPIRHDLMLHYSEQAPFEEVLKARMSGVVEEVNMWKFRGSYGGSLRLIRADDSKGAGVLVIFGDSFSYGFGFDRCLATLFREVHLRWDKNIDWSLCEAVGATHVLWQSAERFLSTVPGV